MRCGLRWVVAVGGCSVLGLCLLRWLVLYRGLCLGLIPAVLSLWFWLLLLGRVVATVLLLRLLLLLRWLLLLGLLLLKRLVVSSVRSFGCWLVGLRLWLVVIIFIFFSLSIWVICLFLLVVVSLVLVVVLVLVLVVVMVLILVLVVAILWLLLTLLLLLSLLLVPALSLLLISLIPIIIILILIPVLIGVLIASFVALVIKILILLSAHGCPLHDVVLLLWEVVLIHHLIVLICLIGNWVPVLVILLTIPNPSILRWEVRVICSRVVEALIEFVLCVWVDDTVLQVIEILANFLIRWDDGVQTDEVCAVFLVQLEHPL